MPTGLKEGLPAPDFELLTDQGKKARLSEFKGKKLVLFFYPKDNTPGCTREACDFRDQIARIRKRGAEVAGVSVDSADSHRKFKEKFALNFPLLADPGKETVRAYGVWQEKSLYGKKYMGTVRTTVVIDAAGRIERIFDRVKVDGHVDEVLAALENAKGTP
ncbi:MAG: thioredoxin-dependent thiol peroxidase [Candidatus Omnitrophica bacterium]|nr:thioredoxin-dependent thiol peroxidase [Candidatus Omnitrophota bacterium]